LAKSNLNIEDELSRCVNQLLLKEPFYAHVLAGTVRAITDEVQTAAVGFRNELIMLMVNEGFFLKELKSASQRTAVIKHEVLHLVFRHLFRDKIKEDSELFNIAADIVVNQYIGQWDLPDSAITLEKFPDLNLKPEESLEYYYSILSKLQESIDQSKSEQESGADAGVDTEGETNGSESKQSEEKETEKPLHEQSPLSAKALEQMYGQKRHSEHSRWVIKNGAEANTADGKPIPTNLISGIEASIDKQLMDAAQRTPSKYYGTMPAGIVTQLDIIRESMKPKLDWKRVLKLFSSASGRTEIYHSMKRVSKRYGTRPGVRIKQFKKIAVIIDTSGSIDEKTLLVFFTEIEAIRRSGAEVIIIECDAAVGNVYSYKRSTGIKVTGGGGTNYDPAFGYINANRNLKVDACVYLTDGYAPEPTIKPRCKLLYVITPDGELGPHLKFGKAIKMN
jgi:predicted metal-dependent peptidase